MDPQAPNRERGEPPARRGPPGGARRAFAIAGASLGHSCSKWASAVVAARRKKRSSRAGPAYPETADREPPKNGSEDLTVNPVQHCTLAAVPLLPHWTGWAHP